MCCNASHTPYFAMPFAYSLYPIDGSNFQRQMRRANSDGTGRGRENRCAHMVYSLSITKRKHHVSSDNFQVICECHIHSIPSVRFSANALERSSRKKKRPIQLNYFIEISATCHSNRYCYHYCLDELFIKRKLFEQQKADEWYAWRCMGSHELRH